MPNKIEYAIAFDADTQQDVVLVRKNTSQPYQKYVFDVKLDRFEKLPEEKKEDKSEISTPQFLPLPPQDTLTEPVSELDKELKVVRELPVQLESVSCSSDPDIADKHTEEPADFSDEDACSDDSFSTAPELERTSSPGSDDFEMLTASGKEDKVEISRKSTSDIDDKPCYGSYHPNEDNKESDDKCIEQKGQGIAQEAGPEPQDNKNAFSDLKNDHQQPSTAAFNYASPVVAATKNQETGTTVYHLLAARNLKQKNAAMFARKRSNVGFEGSDAESTRTALEPSDFDSEDSEVDNESYEDSEYSDEEEEESDGTEEQERVQEHTQEPSVAECRLKNDKQELEIGGESGEVKESRPDSFAAPAEQQEGMTDTSSTPAEVHESSNDESGESEYSDEEDDESYDESDYSDEEEEESDSDKKHEHSGDDEKPAAIESGPENIESGLIDLKKGHQEETTTTSDTPTAATGDQEVKSGSADLKTGHQDPTATVSNSLPPAAATDEQVVKIEASSTSAPADDDQESTTTAKEPSEFDSEESDGEDESEYDSEYSDEDEEESYEEDEEESNVSMDQEPSENVRHSKNIPAENVAATGAQESSSDLKVDNQVTPTTVSEPAGPVTVTNGLETRIVTSRSAAVESKTLVTATDAPETGTLTPSPTGSALPGQQEIMATTSSTPAVPEPSAHESDESDVEDESDYDSEYSDEEEEESDEDSDYSDEEEEESDGLEKQEQPGVAQKQSDTAPGLEDTKSGSSDPKNDHHGPEATVSRPEAKSGDHISVKTALEPSECDSDVSDVEYASEYDSDCSDEEEEESDSDREQEQPADTASGPEDTKSGAPDFKNERQGPEATVAATRDTASAPEDTKPGLSEPKNDHQQPSTAAFDYASSAAATKNQETGTTVYHLLAARNLAQNAAIYARKHSNVGFEGSDAESTRTALEPSEFDSEDSEVEDEDDSEYSDEEEEESGSDGDESEGQGQPGAGQEPQKPSGAHDKNQKPGELASGSQEGSGSRPTASSDKKENKSKKSNNSGGDNDLSGSSDDESNGSEDSSEDSDVEDESYDDSEYSDEEEEESDYDEEQEQAEDPQKLEEEPVQGSGTSMGSETTTTVLSNEIFPICLKQCPAHRQFILHALNLRTQEIGAYILGKDGNLEEVRTPLKLNFRNYSEFKKGDWVIGNGEVNYELDANSRLQKLEYSKERKTFVKCEHGVVKMLAEEEVNAQPPVLRGTEAVRTDPRDSKVNDEESDSEIQDESDSSEETGDDMEDEEVSDEEDPFVYNPGARQEEPVQADPDESIPTARGFRFRVPFLQAVNLNDTANMSDIPLTSPDESFAETSGDDSQYCVMTNDDVLLTKHQKDPNQACCIS